VRITAAVAITAQPTSASATERFRRAAADRTRVAAEADPLGARPARPGFFRR
jgi:hypothetical protein